MNYKDDYGLSLLAALLFNFKSFFSDLFLVLPRLKQVSLLNLVLKTQMNKT